MKWYNLQRMLRRERPHIVIAVRGTFAALTALSVAVLLKLECPYWAAMTALIVIQPTRGLLLEKSYYRLVGTAIGSVAGMLMLLSSRSPLMLTILLSLWLAGCVGIGNLLYGLRSYGAMVAGCTGAVIAMAGYNNPPHLHDLVFGRIACIVIGIVTSTTVTLLITHSRSKRELLERLRLVTVSNIEWVALLVRGADEKKLIALRQDILVEIADIEGTLDSAWAGSFDLKRRKRHVRSLIVSQLSLLEAGKLAGDQLVQLNSSQGFWREPLANHLEVVAQHLYEQGSTRPRADGLVELFAETGAHLPLLSETLSELIIALQLVIDEWNANSPGIERPASKTFIRHRDWQESGRAALRAASAIAIVGVVWHFTGWEEAPLMMMATAIMVSIFSTHDHPSVILSHIFCGATLGVTVAFLCRLYLLPETSSPIMQGIITIPVLMAGIVALYHRRAAMGAMDAMLFFLFVMQPGLPVVAPPTAFVAGGFSCLGGITVAILSFRYLLPIDPSRRMRSILTSIVRDLSTMTMADSIQLIENCQARTHHRVLRMLANARKLDSDLSNFVEGGLAALAIGRCLKQLKRAEKNGKVSEAVMKANLRLSAVIKRPEEILSVLEGVLFTLCREVEKPHKEFNTPVPGAIHIMCGSKVITSELLFVGNKEQPCLT